MKLNNKTGTIFNIQKFSLHDGPGIRTTVFFKGCPLKCRWCANADSMDAHPELMTYDMKCIKCGRCIDACPNNAIRVVDNIREVDRTKCDLCLKCAEVCPTGALEQTGKPFTIAELMKEIEKDKLFYENSGGGVTFSGGEPLQQWPFILEISKKCREQKILTVLDTTGHAHWENMEKVLQYIDLVLYDIKHIDPTKHEEWTGVSNTRILENFVKTTDMVRTWLRVPVIPGFNDSRDFVRELGQFLKGKRMEKISLLPYHTWGENKYERLGKVYPMTGIESISPESLEIFKEMLESYGFETTIGW